IIAAMGVTAVVGVGTMLSHRAQTFLQSSRADFDWSVWLDGAKRPMVGSRFSQATNGYLSNGRGNGAGNWVTITGDEMTVVVVYHGARRHFEPIYREEDPLFVVSKKRVVHYLTVNDRCLRINGGQRSINLIAARLAERGWRVSEIRAV